MSILDMVRFEDARNMSEVGNEEANMVFLSPPYVGHHTIKERQHEFELLMQLLKESVRVLAFNGVVVIYNTDFYLKGGVYNRHDVVREAAVANGLELYAQKYRVKGYRIDRFRMSLSHIQIFMHAGHIEQVRKINKRVSQYEPDVWFQDKRQNIQWFGDAIPPECAAIPILNFTSEGDFIVAQCAGSGTVLIMANMLRRRTIGYEINPEMVPIIVDREARIFDFMTNEEVKAWLS